MAVRFRPQLVFFLALLLVSAAAGVSIWSRTKRSATTEPKDSPTALPLDRETNRDPPERHGSAIRFDLIPVSESGVDFEYYGNPSDEHYMTEQNGGGVALFDADADGRLDLFFANGSHFKKPAEAAGASHRLFRQIDDWIFEDVTVSSGLRGFGFGQGCAAADYDNDGFCDLFLANYEGNRLWHNNGDGTFTEVTRESGVGDDTWGTSAAFADLDGDGHLDLYVVKYVDWSPEKPSDKQIPSPMEFRGLPDQLFRNSGDGVFESVGESAGVAIAGDGKGLALAITDLNGDRLPDIFVANDTTRNFLFRNLGGLKFDEIGVTSGCAVSQDGSIGSSMGVAVGDYNHDGHFDLFVTNFAEELVDAFTGQGPDGFIASNTELGIDTVSRRMLNFGIALTDFDADQWPDLFFANGHLWDATSSGGLYRMPPSLMRNESGKRFRDVASSAGAYFQQLWLGRAAAVGDVDNDGDSDLVVSHLLSPPALLRNVSDRAGKSLRLRLIGTRAARQPLGTRVDVVIGDRTVAAHIPSGESFQATLDDRLIVPVGNAAVVDRVRVHWIGGRSEEWKSVPVGDIQVLIEGTGAKPSEP